MEVVYFHNDARKHREEKYRKRGNSIKDVLVIGYCCGA